MQPRPTTRQAVYAAASACQTKRVQVVLDDPLGGKLEIEAAFNAWRDEWGQDPAVRLTAVRLTFTAKGQAVFDYITDVEYD